VIGHVVEDFGGGEAIPFDLQCKAHVVPRKSVWPIGPCGMCFPGGEVVWQPGL
jgi:hypothetical protein